MELGNYLVYAYNNGILEELYQYAIHLQIPLRENVGFYFIYIFSELYAWSTKWNMSNDCFEVGQPPLMIF